MQIHQIQKNKANKKSVTIGRGGKRGKTSGKGTKGQKARTGNSTRPEIRDMIKRLPKLRGYRFKSFAVNAVPVKLSDLDKAFENGEKVTPSTMIQKGVIGEMKGKVPAVKVLANGEITKKLKISGCAFSEATKEKVEKAGGSIK